MTRAPMLCAELRSIDPVPYITASGLQPADSYGLLPVEQSDGSALVYIYDQIPEPCCGALLAADRLRRPPIT